MTPTDTAQLCVIDALGLCDDLNDGTRIDEIEENTDYIRSRMAKLEQNERASVIASIRAQLADRENGARACALIGIDPPAHAGDDVAWVADGVIVEMVDALAANGASPDALASLFDLLALKTATEHITYRRVLRERLGLGAGDFDGALGDAKIRKRAREGVEGRPSSNGGPKVYKLPEILTQLEEIRTIQATYWLKKATEPNTKEPKIGPLTRAVVSKCGALDELEMHTVLDEIERTPPLLKGARTSILKMWNAAKRTLRREIKPKATDDMVGDAYKARFENQRMYTRSRWYRWLDSGVWDKEANVRDEIWQQMILMKDADVAPSNNRRRSVEEYLQGQSMMGVPESAVDAHPHLLNLANGVYDFETGQLGRATHDLYLTTQLPFEFDADAECPRWLEFLDQVLVDADGNPDTDMIMFMQQAFGYSLTSWTKHEVSFWLQGDGSNGKSTLLRVLIGMSGSAARALNLGMLERDTYQLAELAGVRVVMCSESPVGLKVADSLVKSLVSGETMSVRAPYGKSFQLEPICKVWWAMNNPPRVADTSEGFWRRVKVVPFRACFGRRGQVADVDLKDKLLAEMPGIFNWALEGLHDLESEGWTACAQIEDATMAYRESNDVERAFIEACCVEGDGLQVGGKQLYTAYQEWCKETGHRYKSMTRVASDWMRIGYQKKRTGKGVVYVGVGLLSETLPGV